MKITETIRIDTMAVRGACIKNDWYTMGTNEEYCKMFGMVDALNETATPNTFADGLYPIARDIYEHSNVDMSCYGCTEEEYILNILFTLSNDCTTRSYSI